MVVDDYAIVREGIKSVIKNSAPFQIEITGEASNGEELLETSVKNNHTDIYILDIGMPGLDGIETASRLLKENGSSKIILFTRYRDKAMVQRAFETGIKGYLLKESSSAEIINAIFTVYHGGVYISPQLKQYFQYALYNNGNHGSNGDGCSLTDRQREVFKLICDGLTERQIADHLNISVNTVHVHKTNIMKKLDIHTKTGLIRYGMRERLIPPVL